jgi:cobalt-zinc-cadmium resistance protein CzcA
MIDKILEFSLRQRVFVLLAAIALLGVGIWSALNLPVDAVPDITNVQVQINTEVEGFAPEEIEKLVTFPIEMEMSGIQGMTEMRSLSKLGLSQVSLVFQEGTDIYRARQLVSERLLNAADELPEGITPKLAPITTGLGEIFYYVVDYKQDFAGKPATREEQLMELKLIHDFVIKPQLRTIPGIAEVNASGGYEKQIVILPNPEKLLATGLTFGEIANVVKENVENAGGGSVQVGGEQIAIRASGRVQNAQEVSGLPVKFRAGTSPLLIRDVAEVTIGSSIRTGSATNDGEEAVLGATLMLSGENSRIVAKRVAAKLEEVKPKLPEGVEITTVYDRTDLVDRTISTVEKNLFEGAIFVVVVLLFLLGNWRAALIVSSAIPLAFLFALAGMVQTRVSGNLMSLGAVDFGLIIDGAVVMVENIVRRMAIRQHELHRKLTPQERMHTVMAAAKEVGTPTFFGILIITIVYIPILSLTGVEGKMFKPMAMTVIFALIGALILSLTLMPVLCSYFLGGNISEKDNFAIRALKAVYKPALEFALKARWLIVGGAIALFVFSISIFMKLGAEFIPQLDEGSYAAHMIRTTSIGLDTSIAMQKKAEQVLKEKFPEVTHTFSRIGTAEVATDPMGVNVADTYIFYKPQEEWRKVDGHPVTKDELANLMSKELSIQVPGQAYLFSQPIEMRFNEILEGTRADIAVKVFGDDYAEIERIAGEVREILEKVQGSADVEFDALGKAPILEITPNRAAMTRYNVHAEEVNDAIRTALAGEEAGTMVEGNRRYPIVVRMPEDIRKKLDQAKGLPLRTSDGGLITLGQVADFKVVEQVNSIAREFGQRRAAIMVNLRGRDVESWVVEAQQKVQDQIKLPSGYTVEFGGQFKNLQEARARLMVIVPVALLVIFLLIFMAFGSLRQAFLVFTGIPLAVTGGIFALWLRELPFSISAGIGFIALSGVAVLNGVMMVSYFNQLREQGMNVLDAVREGSLTRLRPVIMTAMVASLGFLPMALGHGAGAEVQRPLATVVIGGIMSATFLTLLLLPTLYAWVEGRSERRRERNGSGSCSDTAPTTTKAVPAVATTAVLLALCLMALPQQGRAAEVPAPEVTIGALVEEALANNPELKFYEAEVSGVKMPATAVAIPQPLNFPARATLRQAVLNQDPELAKLSLAEMRIVLAAQVRLLALEIIAHKELADAAKDVSSTSDSLVKMLTERPPAGVEALLERRILRGASLPTVKTAKTAEAEMAQLRIQLNGLLGRAPEAELNLPPHLPLPELEAVEIDALLAQSLKLKVREAQIRRGVFGTEAAREAEEFSVGPHFTEEGIGATGEIAGLASLKSTASARGVNDLAEALNTEARAKLKLELQRRLRAQQAATELMAAIPTENVTELREGAELAERQYRVGGVSVSILVEIQREYLEAVETRNEAILQAWRNRLDYDLLVAPSAR